MSSGTFLALHRVFAKRELLGGRYLLSLIWSLLASVLLCGMLFSGFLIADLLATGGVVQIDGVSDDAIAQLKVLSGGRLITADEKLDTLTGMGRYENTGIFPSVWWSRDRLFAPWLAALWRNVPFLRSNWTALLTLAIATVVMGLLRSVFLSLSRRQAERLALQTVTRVRRSLHRQALRLGPSDLLDLAGDHVLGLFTRETEQLRSGLANYIYRLGRFPLNLALLLALAVIVSWRDLLICIVPLAACWFIGHRARQRRVRADGLAEDRAASELRILAEALRKTRLVRGYEMEEFERQQFESHLKRYQHNASRAAGGARVLRALGRALLVVCVTIVAFLLGSRVLNMPADLSFAAALLLAGIFTCMYRPVEMLWALRRDKADAALAAAAIYRYLDRSPEVAQAVGAKFLQPLASMLRFDNVLYAIPGGRKLLDGVDLQIRAGEFVAIVSLDPLESKALVHLLPRFIEPQRGRVLYDNVDIAWATLESLRAETVVVGADAGLSGTARENIACGRAGVTLQQVTDAAKKAHAHNFIQHLSQGYETFLGEHGETLDVGQKFRLGLARAAQVDPAVLIVEEPIEPLDDDTKNLIDDAYQRIFVGKTVIALPARLSTVKKADRVIVLHKGKVEAVGTHGDLVRGSGLYRHWEYSRFNEFR